MKTRFTVSGRQCPQKGSHWRRLASWTRDWSLRQEPDVFLNPETPEPKMTVWFLLPKPVPYVFQMTSYGRQKGLCTFDFCTQPHSSTLKYILLHTCFSPSRSGLLSPETPLLGKESNMQICIKFSLQAKCNELHIWVLAAKIPAIGMSP